MGDVFVVLRQYSNFEDSDSNSSDIIGVYNTLEKAKDSLKTKYEEELNFQTQDNETAIEIIEHKIDDWYFIVDTADGVVEGFISEEEVK